MGAGTYSVIYDECQDGVFDAVDTYFPNAFAVDIPANPPPIDPVITQTKMRAFNLRTYWLTQWWHTLGVFKAYNLWSLFGALTNPYDRFIYLLTEATGKLSWLPGIGAIDPQDAALTHLLNAAKHYNAIHADPPDPNFQQLTLLNSRGH
ncbi:MAG: hypothetical protein IPM82_29850 [Saprospiraceae bacterium]|nr:hypothetical protein [Saprospiraceae bacterium]